MRLPQRLLVHGRRIRLARRGCANRPYYQVVAMSRSRPQNAQYDEQLGTLDPLPNANGEVLCGLNFEGIRKWMARGATLSKPVERLLGLCGFLPIHYMTYITAKRNAKRLAQKSESVNNEEVKSDTAEQHS